jgi:hypothetical protein
MMAKVELEKFLEGRLRLGLVLKKQIGKTTNSIGFLMFYKEFQD